MGHSRPSTTRPRGAASARCAASWPATRAGHAGTRSTTRKARWDDGEYLPDSKIVIKELIAADALAGAALWRDLLSRDLVSEVLATNRPADDPLLFQLADPRRARPLVVRRVWVRLIDLPRRPRVPGLLRPVDVVLEVTDSLLPANAGRWRLRAAGPAGGAACERTSDPADIALDVRELGAAYLGGTRLGALAAAGLVAELRPGASARCRPP